jgi:cyclophilin family peptidyl-prolyl cis-trans isomerase
VKLKKFAKNIIYAGSLCLLAAFSISACQSGDDKDDSKPKSETNHPRVEVEMENGDKFVIELYPEYAPLTVDNFVELAKGGFYDGLVFHRIVNNFMAQGGGYDASDEKKEAKTIRGEFSNNGYSKNTLKHKKGVISMARIGGRNDSASSEFFIMLANKSGLDGDYAAFGEVIQGMEVIENFQQIERTLGFDGAISKPVEPLVIKKMTVLN